MNTFPLTSPPHPYPHRYPHTTLLSTAGLKPIHPSPHPLDSIQVPHFHSSSQGSLFGRLVTSLSHHTVMVDSLTLSLHSLRRPCPTSRSRPHPLEDLNTVFHSYSFSTFYLPRRPGLSCRCIRGSASHFRHEHYQGIYTVCFLRQSHYFRLSLYATTYSFMPRGYGD